LTYLDFVVSRKLGTGPATKIPVTARVNALVEAPYTDDELRCLGWLVTDGHYPLGLKNPAGGRWNTTKVSICQKKPENVASIDALLSRLGYKVGKLEHSVHPGYFTWTWANSDGRKYRDIAPGRRLTPEFVSTLSSRQARVLLRTMIQGDGWYEGTKVRLAPGKKKEVADIWAMLAVLAGHAVTVSFRRPTTNKKVYPSIGYSISNKGDWIVTLRRRKFVHPQYGLSILEDWSGGMVSDGAVWDFCSPPKGAHVHYREQPGVVYPVGYVAANDGQWSGSFGMGPVKGFCVC
jgi:hypothetical protein